MLLGILSSLLLQILGSSEGPLEAPGRLPIIRNYLGPSPPNTHYLMPYDCFWLLEETRGNAGAGVRQGWGRNMTRAGQRCEQKSPNAVKVVPLKFQRPWETLQRFKVQRYPQASRARKAFFVESVFWPLNIKEKRNVVWVFSCRMFLTFSNSSMSISDWD